MTDAYHADSALEAEAALLALAKELDRTQRYSLVLPECVSLQEVWDTEDMPARARFPVTGRTATGFRCSRLTSRSPTLSPPPRRC